jgi:hypothetical protein
LPAIDDRKADAAGIKGGRKVPEGFAYTSDANAEWMSVEALREWIGTNRSPI